MRPTLSVEWRVYPVRDRKSKQQDVSEDMLISQAKAAEMCGMTRAAIHGLVHRGRFRAVEVEGRDLVYLKEVEAFAREGASDQV